MAENLHKAYVAFKPLLDKIEHPEFKTHVIRILIKCPEYITEIPSSSTGKYHPSDELESDGMIRHVFRFATFAQEVIRMIGDEEEEPELKHQKEVLIATAILHDIFKSGIEDSGKTDPMHPVYIWNTIQNYLTENERPFDDPVTEKKLAALAHCCLYHEGRWTIPESEEKAKGDKENSLIYQDLSYFAHVCDYFASRRSIYDVMIDPYKEVQIS